MEASYWHQRWQQREIGFHESKVNPALVEHLDKLGLAKGSRIFIPLCGKTLDISWLLAQEYRVVGVELSPVAIKELFAELSLTPKITPTGALTLYSENVIDIWGGDIFDLSGEMLGSIDAVYDRAALVALPKNMHSRYAAHLISLTYAASQLLITYEYDQNLYDGPPFSVREEELKQIYGDTYQLELLAKDQITGGFKGKVDALNATWLLQKAKP